MPATKAKSKQKRTLQLKLTPIEAKLVSKIIERDAMLDVMAKALERTMKSLQNYQESYRSVCVDIVRIKTAVRQYERVWVKGQDEPTIPGRCCK